MDEPGASVNEEEEAHITHTNAYVRISKSAMPISSIIYLRRLVKIKMFMDKLSDLPLVWLYSKEPIMVQLSQPVLISGDPDIQFSKHIMYVCATDLVAQGQT